MVCPHCGTKNREEAKFCAQCGKLLAEETQGTQIALEQPRCVEGETSSIVGRPERPEPLPEGALLSQRRYEIVSFIGACGDRNEYEAVETEPRKRCPICRTLNTSDSNFCEQCGHELTDAGLETLKVRLLEARSPESLQPFWNLAKKGLHHQIVLTPLDAFVDSPYDERAYVALAEVTGIPLGEVKPEDVSIAIGWAHLLAEAFDYMDKKGLGIKKSLDSAIVFTEGAGPVIVTEAISLGPCDWEEIRRELAAKLKIWLETVQAEEWAGKAIDAVLQATDWQMAASALKQLLELVQAPPTMRVEFTAATDVGRRREHNEDSYLTMHFERCHIDKVESLTVLAVADGMGGHEAGEVASKLCLQTFASHLLTAIQKWLDFNEPDWQEVLREVFAEANRKVSLKAREMRNNMGTTLTAAVLCGNKAVFANVGDSRGYLLRSGKLMQITKDHSLVQQYVDAGELTPEQARWHPQRNIITRAIGIDRTVQVDTFEITLQRGDLVLLCSDGLVDMVDDSDIEGVLMSEPNLSTAAQTLIRLANEAGGDDNITIVIARVM